MLTVFISIVALAANTLAKQCFNATVPVTVKSRNGVFGNIAVPETNLDAITFSQRDTQQGANLTAAALTDYADVFGTYNISTQFCMPSKVPKSFSTVQVLTHGIGFDKT